MSDTPTAFEQFEHIRATFRPQLFHDLKEDCFPVGWRGEWHAAWVIEKGAYKGQMAFLPLRDDHGRTVSGYWVPECDLADIERLPAGPSPAVPDSE